MTYDVRRETYDQVVDDIQPLLKEHWRELALHQDSIPLDPDYEVYKTLDRIGSLYIAAARLRGEDRRLVGYAIYFVRSHHHYKGAKWAISDIVLVDREHRSVGLGNQLFDVVETDLRSMGVDVMHTMTKVDHPQLGRLLQARSHVATELSFSKRLR